MGRDPSTHTTTDRGFKHMLPVEAARGVASVKVYESSNAEHPCVWLNVIEGGDAIATIQLTTEKARFLGEQLIWLADNHYQAKDSVS